MSESVLFFCGIVIFGVLRMEVLVCYRGGLFLFLFYANNIVLNSRCPVTCSRGWVGGGVGGHKKGPGKGTGELGDTMCSETMRRSESEFPVSRKCPLQT